jgi:hypothetical protein
VALAVGVVVIRRGHRRDLVVAATLFGAAGAGHLIPAVVAVVFFAAYGVSYLLAHRRLPEVLRVARNVVIVGVGAAALVAVLVFGSSGDMALQGTGGGRSYTLIEGRYDPTLFLKNGKLEPPHAPDEAFYLPPGRVVSRYIDSSFGREPPAAGTDESIPPGMLVAVLLVTLAAALAQLVVVKDDRRLLGLTCWLFGAAMIVGALAFSYRYDLWILASAGERRFYDYSSIPLIVWGLSLVDLAAERLPKDRLFRPTPVVLSVMVMVWLLPGQSTPQPPPGDHVGILNWVRRNTPCDARVLTNTRTTGVFEALTGRVNVSEGMGPYLRPAMLGDLMSMIANVNDFYREPSEHRDFLERNGVEYVLALRNKSFGYGAGWPRASLRALDEASFLEPLVREREYSVYKVNLADGSAEDLPGPLGRCRRTPLRPYEPFDP